LHLQNLWCFFPQDELWDIIYSDSIHPHGLPEAHFIAASQIHDIEVQLPQVFGSVATKDPPSQFFLQERDPYIVRIADALCLDYFVPLAAELDPSFGFGSSHF